MKKTFTKRDYEIILFTVIGLALLISPLFLFNTDFSPTGRITQTISETDIILLNENISINTTIPFNYSNITSLKLNGEYTGFGEVHIYANVNGQQLLIYSISKREASGNMLTGMITGGFKKTNETLVIESEPYQDANETQNETKTGIKTPKTNELINETIDEVEPVVELNVTNITTNQTNELNNTINITPETNKTINTTINETTNKTTNETANITQEPDNREGETQITNPLVNETQNENLTKEIIDQTIGQTTTFTNTCQETCALLPVNVDSISVDITSGTLIIESAEITLSTQEEFLQLKNFTNQIMQIDETITFNLSEYFSGEDLFFDMLSSQGYSYSVNDNQISISAINEGTWPTKIYVYKNQNLLESNEFNITIIDIEKTILEKTRYKDKPKQIKHIDEKTDLLEYEDFSKYIEYEEDINEYKTISTNNVRQTLGTTQSSELMPKDLSKTPKIKKIKFTNEKQLDAEIGGDITFEPKLTLSKWNKEVKINVELDTNNQTNITTYNNTINLSYTDYRIDVKALEPDELNENGGIEFDLVLESIPMNNKFNFSIQTENVEFYYQPPLYFEYGLSEPNETCNATDCQGSHRPENVVGSYAVYHSSKRNNEYKTGKAYHIYRPLVYDSAGNEIWGELSVDISQETGNSGQNTDYGTLSVTVDREWLDNAMYPVTIDPTFGETGGSGSSYTVIEDVIVGSNFTGASGTGDSISARLRGAGGSTVTYYWKFALYDKSDDSLVGSTNEGSQINLGIIPGWKTENFASSPSISATQYYIVAWGDDTNAIRTSGITYDSSPGSGAGYTDSQTYGSWPDPWSPVSNNNRYSIYVTYTAGSSPDNAPNVTLSTPLNASTVNKENVTFICNATDDKDLVNVTLYTNITGSWTANSTKILSGSADTSTSYEVNLTMTNGTYIWNCLAVDNGTNASWASSNYTLTLEITNPQPPIMQTARIDTNYIDSFSDLRGYCNASDGNGDDVTYFTRWYKDDVLNISNGRNESYYCYQETANASDGSDGDCDLSYTGSYSCAGTWDGTYDCDNVYDGNWGTYGVVTGSPADAYVYINYTKPAGATNNSLWQIKYNAVTTNISFTPDCWSQTILQLRLHSYIGGNGIRTYGYCWSGSTWTNILNSGTAANNNKIYESSVWWKFDPVWYTQGIEYNVENLSSDLTAQGEEWILGCLANDGSENSSWMNSTGVTITQGNYPPNNPSVSINSTDGTNESDQDLNCFAIITDPDSSYLNVSVRWYNGSTLKFSVDYNTSYANNSNFNAVLDADNTSKAESWSCSIRLNDGDKNSDWSNSNSLIVKSNAPTVVSSKIYPSSPDLYDDLIGSCNASDSDSTYLSFYWIWYNGTNIYDTGSVYSDPYCYQETPTISTPCGGLSTGSYAYTGNWTGLQFVVDGSWSTAGYSSNGYLYFNYSKPTSATNDSLWQVKYSSGTLSNITISSDCWLQSPLQFRVFSTLQYEPVQYKIYGYCYNGSTWNTLWSSSNGFERTLFYEDAMIWFMNTSKVKDIEYNISSVPYVDTRVGESWKFSCLASDGNSNSSWLNSSTATISAPSNYAPNTPSPTINSSDGSNRTGQNLNCIATITDPDSTKLNVSIEWFVDDVGMYSQDYNNSYNNNTLFTATLNYHNTTKGETWTCRIRLHDGNRFSDWGESGELTILNTVPVINASIIKPDTPLDSDTLIGNCTATDEDNTDILFYSWQWFRNNVLNSSGQTNGWCFQESATVSASCGGLSSGSYLISGDWFNGENVIDGNHSTAGLGSDSSSNFIYVNYSKPPGVTNASKWEIDTVNKGGRYNLTLPSECFDLNPLQLRIESTYGYIDSNVWRCYNGTSWTILLDDAGASAENATIIDEGIWWDALGYPQNISINIANISNSSTSLGDNWTLSCFASDDSSNSNWLNSTTVRIRSGINTMVGNAISWVWGDPSLTSGNVISGTPTSWTWRTYESGSGRQIPNGTATSWTWINE